MKELLHGSTNDPQDFCVIPTTDVSFENMQSFVDDNINIYDLKQIKTLRAYLRTV
jgi:hypothetical protein